MVFGVLKDIKVGENRVICTPIEVATIVGAGHKVLVQKDAGIGSGFSNEAYAKAGAEIRETAAELIQKKIAVAGGSRQNAERIVVGGIGFVICVPMKLLGGFFKMHMPRSSPIKLRQ